MIVSGLERQSPRGSGNDTLPNRRHDPDGESIGINPLGRIGCWLDAKSGAIVRPTAVPLDGFAIHNPLCDHRTAL